MNNTKTIMSHPQFNNNLIALELALQAAGTTIALVDRVPTKLKSLSDQATRSASSVPANIAEGQGRFGKDRQYHWSIAYGSAKEIDVHLRILLGAGVIDREQTEIVLKQFGQVRAMLWRLIHPRR